MCIRDSYEVFADKESLLKECILQKQAERDKYLQEIYEQSNNCLLYTSKDSQEAKHTFKYLQMLCGEQQKE